MANPVIVLDHDPDWPGLFLSLRKRFADALGDMAAAITEFVLELTQRAMAAQKK